MCPTRSTRWLIGSGHMGNIWRDTMTTWVICADPFWPCRRHKSMQYMVIHSGRVDTIIWCNILWYTILWYTMTMWTVWTDAIHSETQYIMIRATMWTTWINAIYGETYWPREQYGSIQYMLIHYDDVNRMNQCNIWGYTMTMWTAWIDAIYGDTYWPCEQYESIQYMAIHPDRMGNTYWLWAICDDPRWPYYIGTLGTIQLDVRTLDVNPIPTNTLSLVHKRKPVACLAIIAHHIPLERIYHGCVLFAPTWLGCYF